MEKFWSKDNKKTSLPNPVSAASRTSLFLSPPRPLTTTTTTNGLSTSIYTNLDLPRRRISHRDCHHRQPLQISSPFFLFLQQPPSVTATTPPSPPSTVSLATRAPPFQVNLVLHLCFPISFPYMQNVHCAHFCNGRQNNYLVTMHEHNNRIIIFGWLLCMSQ